MEKQSVIQWRKKHKNSHSNENDYFNLKKKKCLPLLPGRLLEFTIEFMFDLDGIILVAFWVGGNEATDDDIVDELESAESFLFTSWNCVCCFANNWIDKWVKKSDDKFN